MAHKERNWVTLKGDYDGRISIMQFFNYVMRKVWLQQTRIGTIFDMTNIVWVILYDLCYIYCLGLSLYDVAGRGYLRESDMENYILELIPTLPQLAGLEQSFYSFYVCTAVRKFFFFLDPMRTGRIKIQDVLACSFLDDLLELRDEELSKHMQETNWYAWSVQIFSVLVHLRIFRFSAPSALRVYGLYLNLDRDHNGMLSMEELQSYGTGTMTTGTPPSIFQWYDRSNVSVFLERVFQECLTYEGEMDYKTYLDFVLAIENKREPGRVLHTKEPRLWFIGFYWPESKI